MKIISKKISFNELSNIEDKDGQYYKINFQERGNIVRETKIFKKKYNLRSHLNKYENKYENIQLSLLIEEDE
jgi:hypothetical protein